MRIVADASALVELILVSPRASSIAGVIAATDVHVPASCDVEVASAIRHGLRSNRMSLARAEEALRDYLDLPLHRHGHGTLLGRVLELRENFSAYDAVYVALAEILEAPLLTADAPLERAVGAHTSVQTMAP